MPKNTHRWTLLRTWGIPLVALAAGCGLGAGAVTLWGSDSAQTQTRIAASESSQQTVAVALQTLEESVSATGSLAAVSSDSLAFAASGAVTAVYVEAGDTVEAGDVIAEIDTLQLTASLRAAEADLAKAEARLADLEDADDGSDSSTAQIASAEASVAVLEQSVQDAEDAMSDAQLVADISGLVTSQPYEVGDVVSGGASSSGGTQPVSTTTSSTAVSIVGQDDWTVSVSLSEAEVALVSAGDQVTFTSDDVDGEFYGVVADISNLPSTTGGSATYAVTLQVTGDVTGVFDGTSVTADIVYLRRVDVLAIPTNAITTTDGVSTVTVVDDAGTETQTAVTLGDAIGSYTEILDGLTEGENLLVTVTTSAATGSGNAIDDATQQLPGGTGFDPTQVGGGGPGGQAPPGN